MSTTVNHVVRFVANGRPYKVCPHRCSLETVIRNGVDYEGGTTVGMLRVMSRRGDDRLTWDEQKAQAGDPEAIAAIQEAKRIFAQERAKGSTAFRMEAGQPAQRIDQFDATAEQMVLVPRVVGG